MPILTNLTDYFCITSKGTDFYFLLAFPGKIRSQATTKGNKILQKREFKIKTTQTDFGKPQSPKILRANSETQEFLAG